MTTFRTAKLVAAGLLLGSVMVAEAKTAALSNYQWKNRVLVVVAPGPQDDNLRAQQRIFEQNAGGMSERHIVLVQAAGDDDRSREIRRQLMVTDGVFQVILIGKDGNPAVSSRKPLQASELFARVDAMPMRRDEMRREQKQK